MEEAEDSDESVATADELGAVQDHD